MFTFEGLFSKTFLVSRIDSRFYGPHFHNYMRYFCIYITLRGLTTTQTVR